MCNKMQAYLAKAEAALERAERGASRLAKLYEELEHMCEISEKLAAESRALRDKRIAETAHYGYLPF